MKVLGNNESLKVQASNFQRSTTTTHTNLAYPLLKSYITVSKTVNSSKLGILYLFFFLFNSF